MQQEGPQQVHDSEEEYHRKETEDVETPSVLPTYMPQIKSGAKPVKEPTEVKFATYTSLLLEEVPFEGEVLGNIPQLKLED